MFDYESETLDVNAFARARHPPELGEHQASDCADIVPVEDVAQRRLQLRQRHSAPNPHRPSPPSPRHWASLTTWMGASSSVSYSSWISPSICSRMSSRVTMPA